ncbi:hypothetical protein EGW08_002341 [Elysia chlorotica]|uniref:Uncharacterized protein n=1 Tax=Elysia chlorotica TaxID=188477 RepID=A0A433U7W5_ELYCH|nr:hypothetical protein EGW08_002341 [Elysia chlorotica]
MEPTDAGVHSTDLIKLSLRDKKKLKKRREKDGFFGDSKKRHHHSRKKTSRSKSKKSRDENTSHRRHKHHRHGSHTGKETAAKNQREFRSKSHIGLRSESLKERGKDCLPEKKNQKQKEDVAEEEQKEQNQEDEEEEGSAIFIEDELCYIDEPFADDEYFNNDDDDNDYDDDDEYYGAEYWENLYYFDDDGETYDYDGYYFHGEAGDEDYEEEAFDNPEKEDLALEVSLGHEAWTTASLDGSGLFNKHRQLGSSFCATKTEQAGLTQYFPAQDLSASAGDVRLTCLDYLPMIEPPPYQERCPYVGCDIPGASSNPRSLDLPPVPAYRESPASVTQLNKKLKAGRKNLPLWKRFKCSVKETFRFVMPRFIRRNRGRDIEKISPEVTEDDADGDGYGEHNGASVKMKKGEEKDNNENKEEPLSLEDINWNFQPQGGGPQHGGGRKGVRRPIRGRGRGRGRRGMRGRGMRGRGRGIRGMPFRGRGMRAPRRGVTMRGDKSGRPPRGATVPGTATFKDRDKDRDRRRDKAREHKHRKMSSKSSKQVSSAIGDLQKKLRAVDDRGRVSVRTKQKRPKEPRDGSRGKSMSVVYYCPPKDTESVASQTSKPPRSKLMEFFCPFCRFNVEWT